jgi:hypothetical protein
MRLAWIAGMMTQTAVRFHEERAHQPDLKASDWFTRRPFLEAKVIGLAVMEVWRVSWQKAAVFSLTQVIPHTGVGAFVGGYFCDVIAGVVIRAWKAQVSTKDKPEA